MLTAAKICLFIAILATLNSLYGTWQHLSDPTYDLHAQLHFGREVFVSLAILIIAGIIMYGPASNRNRASWIIMAVGIIVITVGFWLSILFTGAEVPGMRAGLNHILNTVFGITALALCWPEFNMKGSL